MKISELKRAIREMIVSELTEAESFLVKGKTKQIPMSFPNRTAAQKYDTENTNVTVEPLGEDDLNEMAFLKGPKAPEGLEAAITAVVKSNSDAELADIRKAVKTDEKVISALKKVGIDKVSDGIADNQLNNFIELIRGNRVIGKLGRPADPTKPAKEPKEPGMRGRPKGSTKSNDALAFTMGGNVSISGKNVSPAEKKKAVRAAEKNKPIELLKIKDIAVIDTEINDLASELKSKIPTAKQISSKGDDSRYTEEEAAFMNDLKSKSERLKQLKATREKLQTKSIRRQDRNIDVANVDLD